MNIGERIKRRREELNISQTELARMVGYTSRSTITKIERDGNGISQDKIVAIAKALKTTPSYLMGWIDVEETPTVGDRQKRLLEYMEMMNDAQKDMLIKVAKSLVEE